MDGNTPLVSILTPSAVKSWKILTITLPSVAITLTFFLNVKKSRTVIGPNSANHRGKRYNLDNRIVGHRNDSRATFELSRSHFDLQFMSV